MKLFERMKKYRPDCDCFNDERGLLLRTAISSHIGRAIGTEWLDYCRQNDMCRKTWSHVMDDAIINIATNIAIYDTIIECGSVEAEREVLRVLTGIEARLKNKLHVLFEEAREEIAKGNLPRIDGRGDEYDADGRKQ